MNTKIVPALALSALLNGCSNAAAPTPAAPPAPPPVAQATPAAPRPAVGRFVVIFSPHSNNDVILLDTVTGRSWFQAQYNNIKGAPLGWVTMEFNE